MLISHVQLSNWRNFRKADITLDKRAFIIGPNASGKSNLLDAFLFLKDVSVHGLEKSVDMRGGISRIRCLAARQNPDIKISITIDSDWIYTLIFGGSKGKKPTVKQEIVQQYFLNADGNSEWRDILNRPDSDDNVDPERLTQTALQQVNANKDFREISEFFKSISYRHILPQAVRDPKGFSPTQPKDDPFGRDLVLQIWNTTEKTRTRLLDKINTVLKVAVPQLDNLSVELDQTTGIPHLKAKYNHWRHFGAMQDESTFSDGTLRLLGLFWTIIEKGGPLLLEEPELSLHDEVVRHLPAMFAKLGRGKYKRQVIVSTHSYVLLSDPGIGPGEIIRLSPGNDGTEILPASKIDVQLMQEGLSAADVMLNKTKPANSNQLSLLNL